MKQFHINIQSIFSVSAIVVSTFLLSLFASPHAALADREEDSERREYRSTESRDEDSREEDDGRPARATKKTSGSSFRPAAPRPVEPARAPTNLRQSSATSDDEDDDFSPLASGSATSGPSVALGGTPSDGAARVAGVATALSFPFASPAGSRGSGEAYQGSPLSSQAAFTLLILAALMIVVGLLALTHPRLARLPLADRLAKAIRFDSIR